MEVEAAASSDDIHHTEPDHDNLASPATSIDGAKPPEDSVMEKIGGSGETAKLKEERGKEKAATSDPKDADSEDEPSKAKGAAVPEEAVIKPVAGGSDVDDNASTKDISDPRSSESTFGDASPSATGVPAVNYSSVAPRKRQKRGDLVPVVATRRLPTRNSRVAATLQNQFVVECERFGWLTTSSKGKEKNNTMASIPGAVAKESNVAKRRSTRQSGATTDSLPKEQKKKAEVYQRRKRSVTASSEAANVSPPSAKAGSIAPGRQKKGADSVKGRSKSKPSAEKPPPAREPPPTDCGRPRRHAADRAAAAILAAAAPSHEGFLVMDIPAQKLMAEPQKKRTIRKRNRASADCESSTDTVDEQTKKSEEQMDKNAEETRGDSNAEKPKAQKVTMTVPDLKEDAAEAKETAHKKANKTEVAAAVGEEAARTAEELRVADEMIAADTKRKSEVPRDGADGEAELTV